MADPDLHIEFGDCVSCPEKMPLKECPKSLRPCGHHCNHSWEQDRCHWCGVEFGEDGAETWPEVLVSAEAGDTDG
jgi:hypothetical protein